MEDFSVWWNGLELVQQILYCVAFPATLILLIQTILLCLGFGHGGAGIDFSDTSGIDGAGADFSGHDVFTNVHDGAQHFTGDGGNPGDFAAFNILTIQGVVAFLCVFSWSAIILISAGANSILSIAVGFILGVLAMLLVAKVIQLSARLQQNGNININNMLGQSGTVYIPIPAYGKGTGKVNIAAGERFVEFDAITELDEALASNTQIRVCDVRSGNILVVEKQD